MLSREDNDRLTRVGPGTPMGELMRRYWIPAAFTHQVEKPDSPPIRVRLLGEDLVLFRDTQGRVGLVDDKCPHRTASLFFGRNEEGGLRCVYHGLKFDVDGNCVDAPCVPQLSDIERRNVQKKLAVKSYPCLERGDVIWTYMGPAELKPEFPELEWTLLPSSHRYPTRHIQECNWLQGLEGGFDATHLTFLHGADSDPTRKIVATMYEVQPTDFGFVVGTGRDPGNDTILWNLNVMLMPFHKIISSMPRAAHVWAPIDDDNTMLYSVDFHPTRPLNDEDLSRSKAGKGIHTENIPGTDYSIANKRNDYLIDREWQASGKSYTGIKGFGNQDCSIQESMGPIADRSKEHLLPSDAAIAKIRRLLLQTLRDMEAGKPLPGMDPASYRVRSTRLELPKGTPFAEQMMQHVRVQSAAE
ncbi:MAG TPA: Rieske 2Fe-2S domain-containing protein [Alphaproteobacteria bacterium]|nr:Rieske 2Fe-2S domain-containing protein [Alphaproteobacteria bacterium]